MNNNTVQNTKVEVPQTSAMNDRDYLNDILNTEKCMSDNLSIALNEASNDYIFKEILPMFNDTKAAAKDIFNLLFQNGWYSLEKAEQQKIQQKQTEFSQKLTELTQ
ncbi:MAG: spore coat protein [Bacilli bacterium]|nr:spore coat protein [Bacilli bacterium]MDD4282399.1 spore coat protein [Bacilli bacterium]MDD4718976.1 spore coat protein [Bacilli bacterium]